MDTSFSSALDTSVTIKSGSDRVSSYSQGLPNTPTGIFSTTGSLQQVQDPQYYDGTWNNIIFHCLKEILL